MKTTVIGTGYVGLTTAVALAYIGHEVACVDMNQEKIDLLRQGKAPFYEPHLEEVMNSVSLNFTTSIREGLADAEVVMFAVGTPQNPNGSANLTYLNRAFADVLHVLEDSFSPVLLVNKCTAPVGTTETLYQEAAARHLTDRVNIASNPEFLRQGNALADNLYPARLVFGGNPQAYAVLLNLYAPIINQDFNPPASLSRPQGLRQVPLYTVDTRSAELAKYAANAFLAMKISFINEIANLADLVEADVTQVADIIGADPRIGRDFLNAGVGYGGSCFPKDTHALRYIADVKGYDFKLLSAVIDVNNTQHVRIVNTLREALGELREKTVAVLGLTFKPGTDDLREAPSIPIIHRLIFEGAFVQAHDPVALDKARFSLPPKVKLCENLDDALADADAMVIITEWPLYKELTPEILKQRMRGDILVDGRNCLEPQLFVGHMIYIGVGRGSKFEAKAARPTQIAM